MPHAVYPHSQTAKLMQLTRKHIERQKEIVAFFEMHNDEVAVKLSRKLLAAYERTYDYTYRILARENPSLLK